MSKKNAQQSNVVQQIEELKNKIQLLEGDTKAYYESSQFTIKKNTEKISKLRKENKELRKCQADKLSADEHVVCEGLKDHPTEKHALKSKPAPVAISIMDQKHCELLKKLNAERHLTAKKQKRLEQLKTKQDQMTKDAKDAVETDAGESDEAQTLRSLENRLDKAELKCKEAEHIQRTYMQIKEKLEKEHENHGNMLDDGENEIRRLKQEKKELETMQNDAVIARDAAKEELARLEKHLYEERKKREIELQQMKKEAEEKRIQQEKIMTRIATQTGIQSGEDVSAEQHLAIQEEEEQRRIGSYEEVFRRIKDATGVSETKDVIWRFENQDETTRHLEELKATNEGEIARLREDKDKLQKDFEEMKYSGEAKMSSGQRMLEECEMHVAAEEQRMDISKEQLDKSSRVLTDAKSGIEHLAKKLFAIKTQSSQVQKSKISPTSDEYVLDQLSISEEKLLKLLEELEQSGKDVDELSRLIEEEDFHNTVDQNLPKHNIRVKLPATKTEAYIGDEESGDDDEIMSREGLKKQSQQIVDAKTRRRPGKKKKGK